MCRRSGGVLGSVAERSRLAEEAPTRPARGGRKRERTEKAACFPCFLQLNAEVIASPGTSPTTELQALALGADAEQQPAVASGVEHEEGAPAAAAAFLSPVAAATQ